MPHQSEAGRALPALVLEQLVAALPRLEQASRRVFRVAVQLLIDSGRRPDEVCALRWDCLEQDGDGKHSLVYSDYKNRHRGRRLAIADQTAKLIGEQQQMVRAQFPDTPTSELALLPTTRRNPNGTRPITQGWLARIHRDRAKVFLYAYRHSYAPPSVAVGRHRRATAPTASRHELHASLAGAAPGSRSWGCWKGSATGCWTLS